MLICGTNMVVEDKSNLSLGYCSFLIYYCVEIKAILTLVNHFFTSSFFF